MSDIGRVGTTAVREVPLFEHLGETVSNRRGSDPAAKGTRDLGPRGTGATAVQGSGAYDS